ncbi:MAG: hypothetical protein ACLRSD_00470 [Oscillibacter sp.]
MPEHIRARWRGKWRRRTRRSSARCYQLIGERDLLGAICDATVAVTRA